MGIVGIVVVSHSALVADGVLALARSVAGNSVPIEAAGGSVGSADGIGTDPTEVVTAIERAAQQADHVVVLMDLGSAVTAVEMALARLAPAIAGRIRLCSAPVVEGAVAAAVAAATGASVEAVAAEACRGLAGKQSQLGESSPESPATESVIERYDVVEGILRVAIANGLHSRPAARFVRVAAAFDADIAVENVTTGAGPARATSLTELATLGARDGHELRVRAHGTEATAALTALHDLAARRFDETAPEPPSATAVPLVPSMAFGIGADGALHGLAAAPGAVVGPARRLVRSRPTPRVPGDPAAETAALRQALERARNEVRFARDALAAQVGEEQAQMLDAHTAMLDDPSLVDPAISAISRGTRAEEAWIDSVTSTAGRMSEVDDPYLRARAEDVRDIGRRVLGQFSGEASGPPRLRGPGILVARELGVGETALLDLSDVTGIAVATGSPTSHAAILARSLGIPAVVNVGEILTSIGEEQVILVDGDAGTVRIGPDPATIARVEASNAARAAEDAATRRTVTEPAVTVDGVGVDVTANVISVDEVGAAVAAGADGIGLFRTEFLFMNRDNPPSQAEQEAAYTAAARTLGGRRLIVRTLDAGGDKPVPYLTHETERNPFLGRRGVRLSLHDPELFRTQLRAVLAVGAEHRIAVMFPMVATVSELIAARAELDLARQELVAGGRSSGAVEIGVMVEVPAAALCADVLARHVDFFSIGSNDLTQYALAAERGNPAVVELADGLHPAVLRLIHEVCAAAEHHGRWVGVCGELAGDPDAVGVLIGLGVTELSVSAPRIADTKARVRAVAMADAGARATTLMALDSAEAVRAAMRA